MSLHNVMSIKFCIFMNQFLFVSVFLFLSILGTQKSGIGRLKLHGLWSVDFLAYMYMTRICALTSGAGKLYLTPPCKTCRVR